jgi:DNA mismatch repair protein MutL
VSADHAPRRIRLLSQSVADRIAAGEVVERPASVVKELVENALDAGATEIAVDVEGAGAVLVRVADDGSGIHPDDLRLAVRRFATSKISSADDLSAVHTLGFRGEALPSIAAVSHLEVTTAIRGIEGGRRVTVRGGEIQDEETVGAPAGTVVTVRHLFFNTPARRKFLKSPAREFSLIVDALQRLALINPDVGFRLSHEGNEVLRYPVATGADRAGAVLGERTMVQTLPVAQIINAVEIGGWLGRPELARGTRRQQFLFVNRRSIQNRMLSAAIEQAYEQIVPAGRHPVYVITLALPLDAVDVNVHPRKLEIRFDDDHQIYTAVNRAVRETLRAAQLLRPVPVAMAVVPLSRGALPLEHLPLTGEQVREAEVAPHGRLPAMRLLGQLHRTYVLAQGERGLIVIDQHAAHERVLYERILTARRRHSDVGQTLITPQPLVLNPGEFALWEQRADALRVLGFDLEPFGGRTVLLRSVPQIAAGGSAEQLLRDLLVQAADDVQLDAADSVLERLTITTACRSAVRAGDPLTSEQMVRLLNDLAATDDPFTCFHGRPTMVTLPLEQVERWFLRR